jgi:hypothetical protein
MADVDTQPGHESDSAPEDSGLRGFVLWVGLLIGGCVLLLFGAPFIRAFPNWGFLFLFQPGLWQLLFVIPAAIMQHKKHRPKTLKGLLISASGLFMLNAICSGALFMAGRR